MKQLFLKKNIFGWISRCWNNQHLHLMCILFSYLTFSKVNKLVKCSRDYGLLHLTNRNWIIILNTFVYISNLVLYHLYTVYVWGQKSRRSRSKDAYTSLILVVYFVSISSGFVAVMHCSCAFNKRIRRCCSLMSHFECQMGLTGRRVDRHWTDALCFLLRMWLA